ncbi:MAG: hypothetical protein RIT45_2117 [Pseudomonadota bacterium]
MKLRSISLPLVLCGVMAGCGATDDNDDKTAASTALDCTGAEIPGVQGCADPARYEADLLAVAGARGVGTEHYTAVQKLIQDRMQELGYTVELHAYGEGTNILATKAGSKAADELVIVGAHYDGVPNCTAADDNASGVAGALEVARLLATSSPERTLMFAFWDAVLDFEPIGYFSKQPDSQQIAPGFDFVFPIVKTMMDENGKAGDFITLVYDTKSDPAIAALGAAAKQLGLPSAPLLLDDAMLTAASLGDLRRSDHAAYWMAGYPAVMITDTANFRNTHYHCQEGEDSADRLDHDAATRVVHATAVGGFGTRATGPRTPESA